MDTRPDLIERQREDSIIANSWSGCPTVLAFLFAFPDSDAMAMLDVRGEYFDLRTGDTWDLFFPGYYRSTEGWSSESMTGARPIGRDFGADWYFSAKDFDRLRRHIERSSEHRWEYSGGVDLVLINAWIEPRGDPTIDWSSTISGQVSDRAAGIRTLTLGNVVERITGDLKSDTEESSYYKREVTDGQSRPASHIGQDFVIQALSGIAAAMGMKSI
jgi:hypothetical protein